MPPLQTLTRHTSGASAADSVLEYSDASEGEGDRYFSLPYSDSNASLLGNSPARQNDSERSGGSAFQTLRSKEAHHVVHMSSSSADFPFEDDKSDGSPEFETAQILPFTSIPSDGAPQNNSWVANLAYAFRSPEHTANHKEPNLENQRNHRSQRSSTTMEFPPTIFDNDDNDQNQRNNNEGTPLLKDIRRKNNSLYGIDEMGVAPPPPPPSDDPNEDRQELLTRSKRVRSRKMAAFIAACYLMDYEHGRPPSLSSNFQSITSEQLRLYRIQFSPWWRWLGVNLAVVLLFMAHAVNDISAVGMHTYAVTILLAEVWMKETLYGQDHSRDFGHRDRALVRPMMVFLFALGIESWTRLVMPSELAAMTLSGRPFILVTGIFKPLVLFYTSRKARNALEALQRIGKIVTRVLLIEVFLILSFAAVACRMFRSSSGFETLAVSWLSLFERKYQMNAHIFKL